MKAELKKVLVIIILLIPFTLNAWETYEKVLAVVNSRAITESDFNQKFRRIQAHKKIPASKINYEKSRLLDRMIESELIFETAQKEAILLSNKRIVNQLEGALMKFFSSRTKDKKDLEKTVSRVSANLEKYLEQRYEAGFKLEKDLENFIDFIEKKERIDFISFIDEIKMNIAREQLITVAIGATPPSKEEVRNWYNKNRSKLGGEVHVKHILIIPKGNSLSEEKKANAKAEEIRKMAASNPGSFESLAGKYSEDPGSAKNGGDIGWQMMASLDPYFAGNVNRLNKPGQISHVFKSGFGYHVVKFLGKRPVAFENVEKLIMNKLYYENSHERFKKWVEIKKEEASIKIYMKGYIKG